VKQRAKQGVMAALAVLAANQAAQASEVFVTADISTSTTWTSDNTYNLQQQIYVLPGASLTIEAGTKIISTTDPSSASSSLSTSVSDGSRSLSSP